MIPKPISRGISPTPLGRIISCHVGKSICVFSPSSQPSHKCGESFCAIIFIAMEIENVLRKVPSIREVSIFLKPDFSAGKHFSLGLPWFA